VKDSSNRRVLEDQRRLKVLADSIGAGALWASREGVEVRLKRL
jgi:hypothetical protein